MNLDILPLAVTMVVGPGAVVAIVFLTNQRPVAVSVAYVAGLVAATALGVAVALGIATLVGGAVPLGDPKDLGSVGKVIQYVLVALLAASAVLSFARRRTAKPPRWLGALQAASPPKALRTGLIIVPLMVSDDFVLLTVGFNLRHAHDSYLDALPFIALTGLIAALPLLGYLAFRRRARIAMPKVRDWIGSHSWVVNIVAACVFIALILS